MTGRLRTRQRANFLRSARRWGKREHEKLSAIFFLLPSLLGFLAFVALPVGAAFVLVFYDWSLLTAPSFVGLENFRQLARDEVFQDALVNTVYFTVITVPLSVGIGLLTALLLNQAIRGVILFRSVFLLPYVTVTVSLALVWKWIYLPEMGLLDSVLALVGIDGPAWLTSEVWAMPALIIMSVWKFFGYNMVLFLAGLQNIPEHLYDAAKVDGATAWKRFIHVTLPMLSPVTFFVVVITVIHSFQVFDQALVMTRGGPGTSTTTLVLYIYQVGFQAFKMSYASTIALVLFAAVFIFTLAQFLLQRRWVTYE